MMAQHKWHKEIKAWADGAEIEFLDKDTGRWLTKMYDGWDIEDEYRIKPQPKEPQYLYVYNDGGFALTSFDKPRADCGNYIGKIKLEDNDNGND